MEHKHACITGSVVGVLQVKKGLELLTDGQTENKEIIWRVDFLRVRLKKAHYTFFATILAIASAFK